MNIPSLYCHQFVINASSLRFVQQRQAHFKERADSYFALHAYLATVGLDDPLHNGQAQTATTWLPVIWLAALPARARLIHTIETLEQRGQVLLGDTRAIILHAYDAPAFLFNGQFNIHTFPNAAGIFYAILDQIGQHLSQILRIAAYLHFRQVASRQGNLALTSQREQAFHAGQGEIAQIDLLQVQRHLSCIGPRQQQQAVYHCRHLLSLGLDLFQHLPVCFWLRRERIYRARLRQRPVELQVDNSERRAQFMAGVGSELRLAFEGGFQAPQHMIKGGCQFAKLVPALQMQATAQIGRVDLVGQAGNHFHRSQRFARQPEAADRRDQQGYSTPKEPDCQERDGIRALQSHQQGSDARVLVQHRCNQDAIGAIHSPPAPPVMGVILGNGEINHLRVLFSPGLELLDQAARQRAPRVQDASIWTQQQHHLLGGLVEMKSRGRLAIQ